VGDSAYEPQQSLGVVPLPDNDEAEFEYLAMHYRLEGDTPTNLCRWNREVAEICGRLDEARIWDHLQGLMEEFAVIADGMFNEAVFSQATTTPAPVARVPSPRGDEGQISPPMPYGGPHGILLDRAESLVADSEDEPDSASDSCSLHSSDSSSCGPQTPPKKSRFKSFMPPSIPHPSSMRTASQSRAESTSAATYTRSSYIGRPKRLQVIEAPTTEETPTPVADMDYPDPYGIAAALEAVAPQGSRGGLTSRSTPHSTRPPTPAMLDRKVLIGSAHGSPSGSQRPSVVAATKDARLQPATITRRAQDSFHSDEWDKYRNARCKVFLDWWKSYIDDVSHRSSPKLTTGRGASGDCAVCHCGGRHSVP